MNPNINTAFEAELEKLAFAPLIGGVASAIGGIGARLAASATARAVGTQILSSAASAGIKRMTSNATKPMQLPKAQNVGASLPQMNTSPFN